MFAVQVNKDFLVMSKVTHIFQILHRSYASRCLKLVLMNAVDQMCDLAVTLSWQNEIIRPQNVSQDGMNV